MSVNALADDHELAPSVLDAHGLAAVTLTVDWSDDRATHQDQWHVERFSVWREADLLPHAIAGEVAGMRAGEEVTARVAPGELVDRWDASRQLATRPERFERRHRRGLLAEPYLGRFYPQGFFSRVQGLVSEAITPARITELSDERLVIDTNPPLASFPLQVRLQVDEILPGYDRHGGRCTSPLDELLRFAGLAAPLADGRPTDYGEQRGGLSRLDERPDAEFYARPRLVDHLDSLALAKVNTLYRRLVPAGSRVLDLMASHDSHLQGVDCRELHLLGMNREELVANADADQRVVNDLNASPVLPQRDASLDAIVCTASIEYLVRPAEVLTEVARVLRPGGLFVATFSNRWFPGKEIRTWSELHEFERVGMVTQWLQQQGFDDLHSFSARGWPRPGDDPHASRTPHSDPLYAVWGSKPGA